MKHKGDLEQIIKAFVFLLPKVDDEFYHQVPIKYTSLIYSIFCKISCIGSKLHC